MKAISGKVTRGLNLGSYVVAADNSGARIVRKEHCGIIVDATNIDELVNAIELLNNSSQGEEDETF